MRSWGVSPQTLGLASRPLSYAKLITTLIRRSERTELWANTPRNARFTPFISWLRELYAILLWSNRSWIILIAMLNRLNYEIESHYYHTPYHRHKRWLEPSRLLQFSVSHSNNRFSKLNVCGYDFPLVPFRPWFS